MLSKLFDHILNIEAGRRLLLLECQCSIFIFGLCNFVGLILWMCFFIIIISASEPIGYCVTMKYLIMRIMCSSAYIITSTLNSDIRIIIIRCLLRDNSIILVVVYKLYKYIFNQSQTA